MEMVVVPHRCFCRVSLLARLKARLARDPCVWCGGTGVVALLWSCQQQPEIPQPKPEPAKNPQIWH